MKYYSVEPGKDAQTWLIKIEGVAAGEEYDKYDDAVEAGDNLAQNNKPSTLTILNEYNNVQEKRTY